MSTRRKTLIAVLVGVACTATTAEMIDPKQAKYSICGDRKVTYINGIITSQADAALDLQRLIEANGNAYHGYLLMYALAYNKMGGFPVDFYQSVMQVLSGYANATWTAFYNAVQSSIYSAGMSQSTAQKVSATVDDRYAFLKPAPYADSDLASIMNSIGPYVSSWAGRMNVFVCHSQGNLYCNLVYDKLLTIGVPSHQMGFVGVAVPYPSVRGGNTYVTSTNDLVIDSVRAALSNIPAAALPLPGNVTAPYDPNMDITGHGFIETYLTYAATKNVITNGIRAKFDGLKQTQIKTADIDSRYTFQGRAAWRDCTVPLDAYGYTRNHLAPKRPDGCGSGYPATMPGIWIVPVVDTYPVGPGPIKTRPGSSGEVPGLAKQMRDGCIAMAAGLWPAQAASGYFLPDPPPGQTAGNCAHSPVYDPVWSNARLADRYNGFRSGDGPLQEGEITWPDSNFLQGSTTSFKGPTCRN